MSVHGHVDSLKKSRAYIFIKSLVERYINHSVAQIGGQLSYFAVLSLFPFLIYINAVIAAINVTSYEIIEFLSPLFPQEIVSFTVKYIESISSSHTVSLVSIGIIATLYTSSRVLRSAEIAINRAYNITEKRRFFRSVGLSMLFMVCLGVGIILLAVLTIASRHLVRMFLSIFNIPLGVANIIVLFKWIFITAVLFVIMCVLYYFLPNRKMKIRRVLPGALFAVGGFSGLSAVFSVYSRYATKYSVVYSSIGAVFLLLFWAYLAGIIIVLGAEINSVCEEMQLFGAKKTDNIKM